MKRLLTLIPVLLYCSIICAQQTGTFTDSRDGKIYKTKKAGNYILMEENLKFAPSGTSWCLNDSLANCDEYGRMYDWETAKCACPEGWYLPSLEQILSLDTTTMTDIFASLHGFRNEKGKYFNNNTALWLSNEDESDKKRAIGCGFENEKNENKNTFWEKYDKANVFYVRCIRTWSEKGTFTDNRDNRVYKTLNAENVTVMMENLKYAPSGSSWCYENNDSNCDKNGRLYNWETAKNACPSGWKLPSFDEFKIISDSINIASITGVKTNTGFRNDLAGCWYSLVNMKPFIWSIVLSNEKTYKYIKKPADTNTGYYLRCVKDDNKIIYPQNLKETKSIKEKAIKVKPNENRKIEIRPSGESKEEIIIG